MKFNEYQKTAINVKDNNWCVIAGAGSGKTAVLTTRIVKLIASGVPASEILAITFTKNGADNMIDRLKSQFNIFNIPTISTCHSFGLSIMNKFIKKDMTGGLTKQYWEQMVIGNICVKELGLFEKIDKVPSIEIKEWIDWQKINLRTPDDSFEDVEGEIKGLTIYDLVQIYSLYEKAKLIEKKYDYTDMLYKAWLLLLGDMSIRTMYQNKYKYILVDEAQDCNMIQIEIIKLINNQNVFFVGDHSQCWEESGIVKTLDGEKLIKDIKVGDMVETVKKKNVIMSKVTNTKRQTSKILEIYTETGKVLKVTSNHKMFATQPLFEKKYIYVYLMYRHDMGFRIGVTTGGSGEALRCRTISEGAEKIWIIGQYENMTEATFMEDYLSLEYKIPKNPFRTVGRNLRIDQEKMDRLFYMYGMYGFNLISDLGLNFDYPSYSAQSNSKNKIINIRMNVNTGNEVFLESGKSRIRKHFKNYNDAINYANELKNNINEDNVYICEKLSMYKNVKPLNVILSRQVFKGMKIPILNNNKLELETVVNVIERNNNHNVYDIEVEETGILVVNSILSHNSIFGFAGSYPDFILDFDSYFPNGKYLNLPINYRCSKNIVDMSNKLISNADESKHRCYMETQPFKPEYKEPEVKTYKDEESEAKAIVKSIIKKCDSGDYDYDDFAILMRINAQSRHFEVELLKNNIPYQVIGSEDFYSRKEIRDLINFLKVIRNNDEDAFHSIYNVPNRYLGKEFSSELIMYAQSKGMNIVEALKGYSRACAWKHQGGVREILNIISYIRRVSLDNNVANVISELVKILDYDDYISKQYNNVYMKDNIEALIEQAKKYDTIGSFLDMIEKLVEIKRNMKVEADANVVKIMTVHKSKGLEFPVVFVVSMNQGLFPHKNADFNEERRLAYVAITRAEKELYISSTIKYRDELTFASDFIDEMFN